MIRSAQISRRRAASSRSMRTVIASRGVLRAGLPAPARAPPRVGLFMVGLVLVMLKRLGNQQRGFFCPFARVGVFLHGGDGVIPVRNPET